MSTPKPAHKPGGTPEGGQFASTAHPEAADLELDGHDVAVPTGTSTWTKLEAAYAARNQTNGDIERLSAQEMADNIRARYPTAASLYLEDSDQGAHFAALRITDAAGTTLHHIGDEDIYEDVEADDDLNTLASNFDNDSVSKLLTNYGTRRAPDYRLDLAGHGTPAPEPELPRMSRTEAVQEFNHSQLADPAAPTTSAAAWTSASVASRELPWVPLADVRPGTPVFVTHPEIQAGAIRDKVLRADGSTTFHRRRDGIHPNEPYAMRFQTSRPIDDAEMHQMAGLVGYAYTSKVRGEPLGQPVRDSPYSFTVAADTTKSRRDDLGQAMQEFEQELPAMVRDGSPVRTTDRNGPAGTRLVLGLGDPNLTFETYYDSVALDGYNSAALDGWS